MDVGARPTRPLHYSERVQTSHGRDTGGAFSEKEQAILDLLCRGDDPERGRAREQLRFAAWGGYAFDECDCFLISVPRQPKDARLSQDDGPLSVLDVSRDGEGLGHLELWVIDGRLHSVDYSTFEDHDALPDLHEAQLTLVN